MNTRVELMLRFVHAMVYHPDLNVYVFGGLARDGIIRDDWHPEVQFQLQDADISTMNQLPA